MKKKHSILLLLFVIYSYSQATYIPGNSYFGTNDYVEYIPGDLPIIISVPHGGSLIPSSIPDRTCGLTVKDSYTQELVREIKIKFFNQTGYFPHIIINLLHRIKLDANRPIPESNCGDLTAEIAFNEYQNFIQIAKDKINLQYHKGLFVDLHGHGHTIQRIEMGYSTSGTDLGLSDAALNNPSYFNYSSIKNLVSNNLNSFSYAELLRGTFSMGTYFGNTGFPSVPSQNIPAPGVIEPYFEGGYNTQIHGSLNGGAIDAIQMELNQDIRFTTLARQQFADAFVQNTITFLDKHYFPGFAGNISTYLGSNNPDLQNEVLYYPNPSCNEIFFNPKYNIKKITFFDLSGKKVYYEENIYNNKINIEIIGNGLYIINISDYLGNEHKSRFVKSCNN